MIKYQHVSMSFPDTGKILDDLNFEIKEGEFFVLVGPVGVGRLPVLSSSIGS